MLIKQIIEFRLRKPDRPFGRMYSYNWLTSWQNNNLKSSSGLLFTAKALQEVKCLTSLYMDQINYN